MLSRLILLPVLIFALVLAVSVQAEEEDRLIVTDLRIEVVMDVDGDCDVAWFMIRHSCQYTPRNEPPIHGQSAPPCRRHHRWLSGWFGHGHLRLVEGGLTVASAVALAGDDHHVGMMQQTIQSSTG